MNVLLRSAFACFVLASLLSSCKSADKIMFRTTPSALSTRLPSLEMTVDNGPLDGNDGAWPEDAGRLFERELRMNMSEPEDTARYGHAKLVVTQVTTTRPGKGLQAIQLLTFMTPSFLGVPLEWYDTQLHAELHILNSRGEELAVYRGVGRSHVKVAMYHGYSQSAAPRLADVDALRLAIAQIKPQLDSESPHLRDELLAAGTVGSPIYNLNAAGTNTAPATAAPAIR